jgi:stage II sporulation protein D
MRTLLTVTGVVLALAGAAQARPQERTQGRPAVQPVTSTTFLLSGRGWGHGVGMSQYGALGMANDGASYDAILAHFYRGTMLGAAPVGRVRVLVAEAKASVTVSSDAPFRVRDVFGKTYALAAGDVKLGPTLEVVLAAGPRKLAGPLTFLPGREPLEVGTAYRGQIDVSATGKKLNAVNDVGLEDYLAGVVPREMPAAWAEEALKAQAVAARSYALAHRVRGQQFDLYADVRSQVYGGVAAEDARATAAITATAGEVLTYDGKIVDALFHSTSGGSTISAAEAFGTAVPYLVAVADPHSALSPVHRWGPVAVTDRTVRKGLKLATPVTGLKLTRLASGRVGSAVVTTSLGTSTVSGSAIRSGLGLRSTWVTKLTTLALTRPGGPVPYGRSVTVQADARGSKGVTLARRVGGRWETVLARPNGGRFSVKAKLEEPATFRLSAGELGGTVLRVPVAPRVSAKRDALGVAGVVAPATAAASVELQRLEGERWLPVTEAAVGVDGAYRADAELGSGSYRVRVAPASGLAEGLSPTIRVA